MGKKKRKYFIGSVIFFFILLLWGFYAYGYAFLMFQMLKTERKHTDETRKIVEYLASNEYAVKLSLSDFDIFGGDTYHRSSRILWLSKLDDVNNRIEKYANVELSQDVSKKKAIEANYILWIRTKELKYVLRMFDMVYQIEEGEEPLVIEFGRNRLEAVFDVGDFDDFDFLNKLDLPAESPLLLTRDEFAEYCEKNLMPIVNE